MTKATYILLTFLVFLSVIMLAYHMYLDSIKYRDLESRFDYISTNMENISNTLDIDIIEITYE